MRKWLCSLMVLLSLLAASPAYGQKPDVGFYMRPGLNSVVNPVANNTVVFDTLTDTWNVYTAFGWKTITYPFANFSATTNPTTGDDSSIGYSIGSQWLNTVSGDSFVCISAVVGAAVWQQTNTVVDTSNKLNTVDVFSDWLVNGCIGSVPFGGLAMTSPSGVAYVTGLRVAAGASPFTYAASKDTYCFLQTDGTYIRLPVNNGNPAPSTTGLLIQKVVTNATDITAVTQIAAALPHISVLDAVAADQPLTLGQSTTLYPDFSLYANNGDILVGTASAGAPAIMPTGANGTLLGVVPVGSGIQYYDMLGTDISIAKVGTSMTFSNKIYPSPNQTITSAGTLTLPHGLGHAPTRIWAVLICAVAEGNYAPGDEVHFGGIEDGYAVTVDATNINVIFGDATNPFYILDKTTGAAVTATNANWLIRFYAQ